MTARKVIVSAVAFLAAAGALLTAYIRHPTADPSPLEAPLRAFTERPAPSPNDRYATDYAALTKSFRAQVYRSYCGPSSLATVLRAYGVADADQRALISPWNRKLAVFLGGTTLTELAALANDQGLQSEAIFADQLDLAGFRDRIKENLGREGDFVLVNYDRRVLKQVGAGHISPIAAYDANADAFLILDEAAYKYPFTWVPATALFASSYTKDGDHYRGILIIHRFVRSGGA